jgi:hypothetical protein
VVIRNLIDIVTTLAAINQASHIIGWRITAAWKDTIIVPRRGRVTMLVPVMDYTGITVFHCHILEHEDIGMMGVWKIGYEHPTEKWM